MPSGKGLSGKTTSCSDLAQSSDTNAFSLKQRLGLNSNQSNLIHYLTVCYVPSPLSTEYVMPQAGETFDEQVGSGKMDGSVGSWLMFMYTSKCLHLVNSKGFKLQTVCAYIHIKQDRNPSDQWRRIIF